MPLSVLFLTYNEEANIEAGLRSVQGWANEILVVDSGSTDGTLDIVRRYTSKVYHHPFESWGQQVNWALANLPFQNEWVFRLDADEFVTPELRDELLTIFTQVSPHVTALYVKRRVFFMGRWIRHGGFYPAWLLRLFKRGKVLFEQHLGEAEHALILDGIPEYLRHDIVDWNRKDLRFWTLKHENYAQREVQSLLNEIEAERIEAQGHLFGSPELRKRWLKTNIYSRVPPFSRAFLYFFYRYFLRLGFLDGTEGFIFHVLQGFWYRFYVDAKIWEATHRRT
ncbi:MAG: glycosyltransferase family 2 protein [Caldilineaceae bacterium]|nr:glycosyltransferase family 2 protein [Caldilineaceae bacterium]